MDHAQRGVAVLHRIGDDAQRHEVVDLVDRDLLPPHFLEDRVGPLDAPVDARRNALAAQFGFHRLADLVAGTPRWNGARDSMARDDLLVGVRLEVLEGEVFQFAAHLAHAQAVRDGRVDLDGLAGDALPPLGD